MSRVRIFVSYSHEDSRWVGKDSLIPWLARSLQRRNVEIWYDRDGLHPGDEFRTRIEEEIDNANVAILLVSHGFLSSEFIQTVELPRIKARTERRELIVIPILAEPCSWDEIEFLSARHMIPGEPTPLVDYVESVREWAHARDEILKEIRKTIEGPNHLSALAPADTRALLRRGNVNAIARLANWLISAKRRAILAALISSLVIVLVLWWSLSSRTPNHKASQPVSLSTVIKHRPPGNSPNAGAVSLDNEIGYIVSDSQFPTEPPPEGMVYATVGFTVWRSRPATARDGVDAARETIDSQEFVAERIGDSITNGERLYLGIESLTGEFLSDKGGYLYVINREQYADGKFGRARLIFPTRLTYNGKNIVKPGQLIVLPGKNRPFIIKRSSPSQMAETYTIIVSPFELSLPGSLGGKAMVLPDSLVADWEKQYSGPVFTASLRGGLGAPQTNREYVVGTRATIDTAESLSQNEPPPQTCYRSAVKIGNPAMVTVALGFRD